MTLTTTQALLIALAVTAGAMLTRFLPFWIFRAGRPVPPFIQRLQHLLPSAVIGLLVVYCLRGTQFTSLAACAPQLIAAAVTVGLKLGVLPEKIQAGLSQFRNISGRQEIIQAGGMTISLPEEDRSYLSRRYMEDQIVGLLGGRVAEKLCLNDISTGASNDIQRATAIARKMVTVYGMSERLGTVSFDSGNDEVFIGRTMGHSRGYSEAVAAQIDQEVKDLVDGAYRRCQDILEAQRDKLEQVAQYLLEHETMERDAFLTVFGEKTHEQPENVPAADAEDQD